MGKTPSLAGEAAVSRFRQWLFNFARRVLTMVPEAQLRMALVETEPFLISPEITVPMGCGPSCPHTHPTSPLRVVK